MTRGLQVGGVGDEVKDGLRLLHTALALNADSLYLVLNIRLPPNPQANLYLALSFTASKYTLALKGDCLPIEPGVVQAVPSSVASTVMRAAGTASTAK